ncbi:MAG: hypothetical protein GF411_18245 [Candidatus Lokiarchaeota archaeon]|nr:hypothetical protein [Candidatus Lokiarchaeota archaeon]
MISEPFEFAQLIILVLAVVFLVIAIEYRKLSFAIISFAVGNGFLSLAFFALGAPIVAAFNFSVFSGAFLIVFLATMNLDAPEEEPANPEKAEVTE